MRFLRALRALETEFAKQKVLDSFCDRGIRIRMDASDSIDQLHDLLKAKPQTLDEAVSWQAHVRARIDAKIIGVCEPLFQAEFHSKRNASEIGVQEACRWANKILASMGLCVLSSNGPASFHGKKSRPSDPGRVYLEPYAVPNQIRQHRTRVEASQEIRLVSIPEHCRWLQLHR